MGQALRPSSLVPRGFAVVDVVDDDGAMLIRVRSQNAASACPCCGTKSERVHSKYQRRLADLPIAGRSVRLVVLARRFHCDAVVCGRRIFVERFGADVLAPWARRTSRLEHIVHHLGLALGGRPGASFAQRLMLPVSYDTLLRVVRRRGSPRFVPPTVIGIDDWAWRRNQRYGTIICDLERRKTIALLSAAERIQYEGYLRREDTNSAILGLSKNGVTIKEIVRRTGYSRGLIRRVLRGQRSDVFRVRENSLELHLPWLDAQWAAGKRNGTELWRQLKSQGFRGCRRVVSEWATRRRKADKVDGGALSRAPSARTIARLMTIQRDDLSKSETVTVAAIEGDVPVLVEAREVVAAFQAMIRKKSLADLEPWVERAGSGLIASFANGVVRDLAAVSAAITSPWSNGQTEGQITKLKLVKRQMYGRGKLDLLQARVIGPG